MKAHPECLFCFYLRKNPLGLKRKLLTVSFAQVLLHSPVTLQGQQTDMVEWWNWKLASAFYLGSKGWAGWQSVYSGISWRWKPVTVIAHTARCCFGFCPGNALYVRFCSPAAADVVVQINQSWSTTHWFFIPYLSLLMALISDLGYLSLFQSLRVHFITLS